MTVRGIGDNDDHSVDILVNSSTAAQFVQQKDQEYDISVHPSVEREQHEYTMEFNLVGGHEMDVDSIDAETVRVVFHVQNPYSVQLEGGDWVKIEQNWSSGDLTIEKNNSVVATYGSVGDTSTITHDTGWSDAASTWTLIGSEHTYHVTADVYTRETVPDDINTTAVNKS